MRTDALVIGGGPAGAATAIGFARAGWRVVVVERQAYPRRKVCGECLSAGALDALDVLGVGTAVRAVAGAPLTRTAWYGAGAAVEAALPRCAAGLHGFGRALGRDVLDPLLLAAARDAGVTVLQPATVRRLDGADGAWRCTVATPDGGETAIDATVAIAAHGSWEPRPAGVAASAADDARGRDADLDANRDAGRDARRERRGGGELLAFKANYRGGTLPPGLLPVLALPGGYGGIVRGDGGRLTLACCVRRDVLATVRAAAPGLGAGAAVERWLRASVPALAAALDGATREGAWLAVGPIRPGIRLDATRDRPLPVGNAAGETHPLVGEGLAMALQSALLLSARLATFAPADASAARIHAARRAYVAAWRATFGPRVAVAAACAHAAMRPLAAAAAGRALAASPALLTLAARLAGKARPAPFPFAPEVPA